MPRNAKFKSAEGATIAALLPPNSNNDRPSRAATVCATARPMGTEPVAETSGNAGEAAIAWPTSAPVPTSTLATAGGTSSNSASTSVAIRWQANAHSGVFSEGFQTKVSPHTSASIAFQAHTATGKLNAVMTPTGPSGCHCSVRRCSGRSLAIVRP